MRRLPDVDFFVPEATRRKRREETVDEAVAAARHLLVVTHGRCLDGVGSYIIHALATDHHPPVLYTHPNEVPGLLRWIGRHRGNGRTLSINDLSFDKNEVAALEEALRKTKENGWRIVWRDHHHTQWEGVDTARITKHLDHFMLDREAKECGTSLAQQDLLPDDPLAKELADIVRDRDLWHNQDPRSERYEFALRHLGTDEFVESFLATRDVEAPWLKAAAEAERTATDEEVETAVLTAELFGDHGEVGVIYGEVPKNVTLHELRRRRGTRLEINLKPDGVFSVRSAKGTDVAHLLGQAYHGGGHPNAAGGKVPVPFWEWPAFWMKGGLSPAGMSVVRTALRLIQGLNDAATGPPEDGSATPRQERDKKADGQTDQGQGAAAASPGASIPAEKTAA